MSERILTRDQIRSVDSRAIKEYQMPGVILMENAGRNASELIVQHYGYLLEKRVAIFCGPGNNGGDGFVIARHLHNLGWDVKVLLAVEADKFKGDALTNYRIVEHMTIPVVDASRASAVLDWAELAVDAMLGTGFKGRVRSPIDGIIDTINASGKPVVAVDVPSGMDCQTGTPGKNTIRAELTVTFAAIKTGLVQDVAEDYVGKVVTVDIGVPRELLDAFADDEQ